MKPSHLGLLACSLLGCTSNELPDDRVWESEHFRYHTRKGDHQACRSVLGELEKHRGLMQGFLGFGWGVGRKVEYYKFANPADLKSTSPCWEPDRSCTIGGQVMSDSVLHGHELVHAYLDPLGQPPPLFSEGVAAVLSCRDPWRVTPGAWRDVVANGDDHRAYTEGPWFVGYLLETYGPAPFLRLYGSLGQSASADAIAVAFADVYGEPLDDVWDTAVAAGGTVRCAFLWECAGPGLDTAGALEAVSERCDGAGEFRTFELPSPADVVLGTESGVVHAPVSCASGESAADASDGEDAAWMPAIWHLEPGRYFIGNLDVASRVRLTLGQTPWLGPSCSDVTPLPLDAPAFARSEFMVTVPNDGQAWFVRTPLSSNFRACPLGPNVDLEVAQCASCDADAACVEPSCVGDGGSVNDDDTVLTYRMTPLAGAHERVEIPFSFVP